MDTPVVLSARWILIDAPPGADGDSCTARLGFESTQGDTQVLGDVVISPCQNLVDAIDRARAVIKTLGLVENPVFSLLYPRYQAEGAAEAEMHRIAWAVKDAADARGWHFSREMPLSTRHLSGES